MRLRLSAAMLKSFGQSNRRFSQANLTCSCNAHYDDFLAPAEGKEPFAQDL